MIIWTPKRSCCAPSRRRPPHPSTTLSWEQETRRSNRKKQLSAQRDQVLATIERAEQRKRMIAGSRAS